MKHANLESEIAKLKKQLKEEQEKNRSNHSYNRLLKILSEKGKDVIWSFDVAKGKFVYVSPSIKLMQGYMPNEFLNAPLSVLMPEHSIQKMQQILENIVPEKTDKINEDCTEEFELFHKNGETIYTEVTYLIEPNAHTGVLEIVGLTRDITEHKKAVDALTKNEQLFRSVFEQAAVGIAQVAPSGEFLKVNGKFYEITGYLADELLCINFTDITHRDVLEIDKSFIEKVLANEIDGFVLEKRYIHKKGHHIWIELHSNVERDAQGTVLYAIAAIYDITERKKAEQDLQSALVEAKKTTKGNCSTPSRIENNTHFENL